MRRALITLTLIFLLTIPSISAQSVSSIATKQELNILAVAVYTSDTSPEMDISEIEDVASSIEDFIFYESFEKTDVKISVIGWKLLPELTQYYASNFSESEFINTKIIPDTLDTLTETDSSDYDCMVIIHSGQSYQKSYFDWGIYDYGLDHLYNSGLRTAKRVAIVSEYEDQSAFVKYIFHSFGVPWLSWDWGWENIGIYMFGVMGGGHAGLCGYTKKYLGFLDDEDIYKYESGTKHILLKPLSSTSSGFRIIEYPISENEYYSVEARLDSGYDDDLTVHGLLLTYVNETALLEGKNGIRVLRRDDCNLFSHAPLLVGESFYDPKTGFTIKYISETPQGAEVVVSSTQITEWCYIERLVIPECDRIWDVQLVGSHDEYMDETHLYMSVIAGVSSTTYLRVYDSTDYGRTWVEVLSTLGSFNVIASDGALFSYEGEPVYAAYIEENEKWCPSLIWEHSYDEKPYYTNLSLLTNADILPWMDAVSSNSTMYFGAYSILNGTAITYLKLDDNGWANTTIALNLGSDFVMLNPVGGNQPKILFRNSTGLYITEFNSTIAYQLTPEIAWNIKGVEFDDPIVAFTVMIGENYSYKMARIVNESLQYIAEGDLFNPECQALSIHNNSLTMIIKSINGTKLIYLNNDLLSIHNISNEYKYSMNKVTPSESINNPIVAYRGHSDSKIYTVDYENTTPAKFERVFWSGMKQTLDVVQSTLYITIVSMLAIGVGSFNIKRRKRENNVLMGERW